MQTLHESDGVYINYFIQLHQADLFLKGKSFPNFQTMSIPYKTSHFSVLVTMGQRDEDIQAQILIISVHLYKDPILWKLKAQVFFTNASCTVSTDLLHLFLDISYYAPLKRWNINCQSSRMVLLEQIMGIAWSGFEA